MANATARSRGIDWQSPQTRILIGLIAPSVMTAMAHHMLGVALPSIRADFGIDADTAAWVVMSYTIPFIALMPLYGRLGDGLGKRRLLLFGTVVFLLGTIVVILAQSLAWLMIGRAIQGVGTAGFVPLCIAIIAQRFAVADRGRVMGAWNSAVPLVGLSVPYFAGLLVDWMGWRAIYPPIFIAGLISFVIIQRNIEALTRTIDWRYLRTFDWAGVMLLAGGLVTLFFYTSSRPVTGVPALQDWRMLLLCLGLFAALVYWERRRARPYVNLGIFRNRTFTVTAVVAGLRMFLMSSISFLLPLYLHDIHHLSARSIGGALALQAGMLFLVSRAGGQVADRWGSRRPVVISLAGLVGVMGLLARLPATAPLWIIFAAAGAHGLIIGLSLAPLHRSAMVGVSDAETGMAAGLYSMIRFAGQIMGTALAGVLLQRGLTQMPEPIGAYQTVFWLFTGVALLAAVLSWGLREG